MRVCAKEMCGGMRVCVRVCVCTLLGGRLCATVQRLCAGWGRRGGARVCSCTGGV